MNDPVDAQRILQLVFMVHRDVGCVIFTEMQDKYSINGDAWCIMFTEIQVVMFTEM